MVAEKEKEIKESYSDSLQCPYCSHRFLLQNSLGISSQQDPCSHLIVFDPVFSIRVRISEDEFEVFEDVMLDDIVDELHGEFALIHDSKNEEKVGNECWTTVYHQQPEQVLTHLSEKYSRR